MLQDFLERIPPELMQESGSVFYSGRAAFSKPAPVYLLGVNPGGSPASQQEPRIGTHCRSVLYDENYENWSAYLDLAWGARTEKGGAPMQRRIAHLFQQLGLDLRKTPASNLIFQRSRDVSAIKKDFLKLADRCWPFHQVVIQALRPKLILCMGKDCSGYVRERLGADEEIDHFKEDNKRQWLSLAYRNAKDDQIVVSLTHPSWANWINKTSDPASLIQRLLTRA